MWSRLIPLALLLFLMPSASVDGDSFYIEKDILNKHLNNREDRSIEHRRTEKRILKNRLNNLESQSIQRSGQGEKALDLLSRQDARIAGQELNSLKTRNPRRSDIFLLQRQLDRSRRPVGRSFRR